MMLSMLYPQANVHTDFCSLTSTSLPATIHKLLSAQGNVLTPEKEKEKEHYYKQNFGTRVIDA